MDRHLMLERLIERKDLDERSVEQLIDGVVLKTWPDVQVAAALALLRAKGESGLEISAAAVALFKMATPIQKPSYACADIVGTGGDGHNTINASTLASLVAASCGVPMAKHGSAASSSKCGSADVLSALRISVSKSPQASRQSLDENGWCFLFAPIYHPAFRQVRGVRQGLKIKTIFNILGPLVNPMDPEVMIVGVYHERLLLPVVEALRALGKKSALVVHGSGLDEITLHASSRCARLFNGRIEIFDITPTDLGLKAYAIEEFYGGDVQQNAQEFLQILSGQGSAAKASLVAANAGALLWIAGKASTLGKGVELAVGSLASGAALRLFQRVQEGGHGSA